MNAQVEIFEDVALFLMGIVNSIDRTKVVMINDYPNWDAVDMAEFKAQAIAGLNTAISKLGAL
jgi:hypothetical protein